jgi:hypothetical protein
VANDVATTGTLWLRQPHLQLQLGEARLETGAFPRRRRRLSLRSGTPVTSRLQLASCLGVDRGGGGF